MMTNLCFKTVVMVTRKNTDNDKISEILDKINSVQYKYLDNKRFKGFVLSIKLFLKDKESAYLFFSSDDVLRLKKYGYKKLPVVLT
jgi:hypothetical protein